MPSQTFFNLSEEKQNKILEASIIEFSRVPYDKASINQIIKHADISRGSFYMYFDDKDDLAVYIIQRTREWLLKEIGLSLPKANGQLDQVIIQMHQVLYDYYRHDTYRQFFKHLLIYFQGINNPQSDKIKACFSVADETRAIKKIIDMDQFSSKTEQWIDKSIDLALMLLRNQLMQSLILDLDKKASQEQLIESLKILKQGYGGYHHART